MAEVSRQERRKKYKRNGRGQKIIIWSLFSLALLVLVVAAYTNMKVDQFFDDITAVNDEPVIIGFDPIDPKYTNEAFAMVLMGMDTREQTGTILTDVLIVAVVEPETKKVTMLSIPRDTAVAIPGYGYDKINSVFGKGESARYKAERNNQPITETGTSLLKKTIEGLLGIPVKHYVKIDFKGFEKVIDELDGIEVDVERRLVYHDPTDGTAIELEKGLQTLDGKKALDYVRHRMDDRGSKYYSTDYDRNRRQQLVITKLVDKMKSFYGITKVFDVMDAAGEHIRTDLSKEKIKGLATDFISIGSSGITILQTGADWDSNILKTVIPSEKLEEIRLHLWSRMGISEKEGRARLLKENDHVIRNLTEEMKQANKVKNEKEKNTEQASSQAVHMNEIDESNTSSPDYDVIENRSTDSDRSSAEGFEIDR